MGYDTTYTLTWDTGCAPIDNDIATTIEDNQEMAYCLNADGSPNDRGRWYDHEADLRALSAKHPLLLFTLEGAGEGRGGGSGPDNWRKYFLGGKMQVAKIRFDFPPFNVNLLT